MQSVECSLHLYVVLSVSIDRSVSQSVLFIGKVFKQIETQFPIVAFLIGVMRITQRSYAGLMFGKNGM